MQPENRSQKKLIIPIIIVIIIVVIAFVFSFTGGGNKTKQKPQTKSAITSYSGLDGLTNIGATQAQINDLEFAIHRFMSQNNIKPQEVIISNPEHHYKPGALTDSYSFDVTIGDKDLSADMQNQSLESVRLTLSDTSGKVFDSGVVDVN